MFMENAPFNDYTINKRKIQNLDTQAYYSLALEDKNYYIKSKF